MGWSKYQEDIIERRRENRAAIVYEYLYPQEHERHGAAPNPPELTVGGTLDVIMFSVKVRRPNIAINEKLLTETPGGRSLTLRN